METLKILDIEHLIKYSQESFDKDSVLKDRQVQKRSSACHSGLFDSKAQGVKSPCFLLCFSQQSLRGKNGYAETWCLREDSCTSTLK